MDSEHRPKSPSKNGTAQQADLPSAGPAERDTNGRPGNTAESNGRTDATQEGDPALPEQDAAAAEDKPETEDATEDTPDEQETEAGLGIEQSHIEQSHGETTDGEAAVVEDTEAGVQDLVVENVTEPGEEETATADQDDSATREAQAVQEADADQDDAGDAPALEAGAEVQEALDEARPDPEAPDPEAPDQETPDPETDAGDEADIAEPVERSPLLMNAVKIRGRPGGVAIEIGEGEWDELLAVLRERLNIAEGFFRGGRVVLDVGIRTIAQDQLQRAFDILADFEMQIAVVRAESQETLEAAEVMGITATTGETEDPLRGVVEARAEEETEQTPTYYVHQGNLRSGQVLERVESVIVIGDVNPGAQVVSNGDILIWGRLRGSAHAGAEDDEQAMVTALEFEPTQLRIAGLTSIPPEEKKQGVGLLFWKKEAEQGAEFAYVSDGRIYVEPWNSAKPGSLASRRR